MKTLIIIFLIIVVVSGTPTTEEIAGNTTGKNKIFYVN
jgi:hypothetical protein